MVLAAGGSSRLGRPKQLLPFRGTTLIAHAASVALRAGIGPVTVMLGAHAEQCRTALGGLSARVLINEHWADGMGSTIAAAARAALTNQARALLLTSCDQPDVAADDLRRIAAAWRTGPATMVAAQYAGTFGIPALFAGPSLAALTGLAGDRGAKSLLEAAGRSLALVSCPAAARDVDTPDDAAGLS